MADHDLGFAAGLRHGGCIAKEAQFHLAHAGQRQFRIARRWGRTSAGCLHVAAVHHVAFGRFGQNADVGILVHADPQFEINWPHRRAEFESSCDGGGVFIDNHGCGGDRNAGVCLMDDNRHGGRVMGAVGRIHGEKRLAFSDLGVADHIAAQVDPCGAFGQGVGNLFCCQGAGKGAQQGGRISQFHVRLLLRNGGSIAVVCHKIDQKDIQRMVSLVHRSVCRPCFAGPEGEGADVRSGGDCVSDDGTGHLS